MNGYRPTWLAEVAVNLDPLSFELAVNLDLYLLRLLLEKNGCNSFPERITSNKKLLFPLKNPHLAG
jgi:hypothetical protein